MPSDVLMNRHMVKLGMAPQSVSWSDGPLTIDDVAKFFSVPIAEAAQKLNVCGSVLQRICKENGIARWPYRKVMAGKSIEEIKEEGLKELTANPSAYKVVDKQPTSSLENISATPVTTSAPIPVLTSSIVSDPAMNVRQTDSNRPAQQVDPALVQRVQVQKSSQKIGPAVQTKTSAPGNAPAQRVNQQSTPAQSQSPAASHVRSPVVSHAPAPLKQKPASSLDDFKIGFPSKGLRRASTRWWGSLENESATTSKPPEDMDNKLDCPEGSILGLEKLSEVGFPTASSLLVRTRKKACLRGRSSIAHAVTRGYGIHKLGAKDAATLKFVFGDSLPKHWKAAFSDAT